MSEIFIVVKATPRNLLHLLEKHGHKAKIDLKEARLILAEQEAARKS